MNTAALATRSKPRSLDVILSKMLGPWIEHYQRLLTFR